MQNKQKIETEINNILNSNSQLEFFADSITFYDKIKVRVRNKQMNKKNIAKSLLITILLFLNILTGFFLYYGKMNESDEYYKSKLSAEYFFDNTQYLKY